MGQPAQKMVVEAKGGRFACWCFANPLSRGVFAAIVRGEVYPHFPFVKDVRTVVDVGANVGAAAIYFALLYPEAAIHALEPASESYALLSRNAVHFPGLHAHAEGLYREDRSAPLYQSGTDPMTASVGQSAWNTREAETIRLRQADRWLREQGIERIDVLKLDTEGCEVAILESIGAWIPTTRIVYVEWHSEEDRLRIDELLRESHMLMAARVIHPHLGEFAYVAKDAFTSAAERDHHKIVVSM